MSKDLDPSTNPENNQEEEPQVFSVVRGIKGTRFNRREFIEKAAVASVAVAVVATTGCVPGMAGANVQGTVDSAIAATQNSNKVGTMAAQLSSVPGSSASSTPSPKDPASPTHSPSSTPTSTDTPTPAKPTLTLTPTPAGFQSAINGNNVNFRSGPGTGYAPITRLPNGTSVLLTGRLADNTWVSAALSDPNKKGAVVQGWIKTNLVTASGKDIANLPVISEIPPTPTMLPGKAGSLSAPGANGIDYQYTDEYGNTYNLNLPCGSPIPAGAVCTCNCVTVPKSCSCNDHASGCSCNPIHYWYPN